MSAQSPDPGTLFVFGLPADNAALVSQAIRNLFTALGCTNYTTDADYPDHPQTGMARINASDLTNIRLEYWFGAWRTALQNLQNGIPAVSKQVVQFSVASNPWTVTHNLGSYPHVTILDASGYVMQALPSGSSPGAGQYVLQHVSVNRFVVTFAGNQAGFAIYTG